jgi:hypothetical protein
MRTLLAVAVVIASTGVGFSQDKTGTVAGAGWVSCAEFAQHYQKDPQGTEEYFYAWAQGYMSGVNQASSVRKNLVGWRIAHQKQHIRSYCKECGTICRTDKLRSIDIKS